MSFSCAAHHSFNFLFRLKEISIKIQLDDFTALNSSTNSQPLWPLLPPVAETSS
jgi:hypothetical protein